MATTKDAVWRNLPGVYRRAGTLTPAYGMTAVLGRMLVDLERTSQDVLRAHFLDHATDLEDVSRLAAWFALAPWPEEDRDAFRTRVRRMVAIYREGAANALRMLDLVAVAMGAEIATVDDRPALFIPRLTEAEAKVPGARVHGPFSDLAAAWHQLMPGSPLPQPNPYATYAILAKPGPQWTWAIPVALLDLPQQRWRLEFVPDATTGRCEWQVDSLYTSLGDRPEDDGYGDPVVEITAPQSHPVSLPVLVQRDLRRLVLVNRTIAPGGVLRVDLHYPACTVTDAGGPASSKALPGQPDLLFGTGALLGEHAVGQGPPPFHLLRWYTQDALTPTDDLNLLLGQTGAAPEHLPWPHLLTPRRSDASQLPGPVRWRLLVASVLPSGALRPLQPTPATTAAKVRFTMVGRRAGTFSLIFDRKWVLGTDSQHPLDHRLTWLNEQVRRLKLAGVIYVRPEDVVDDLGLPLAAPLGQPEAYLTERITMGDAVAHRKESFVNLAETVRLGDGLQEHRLLQVALADRLAALDAHAQHAELVRHLQDELVILDRDLVHPHAQTTAPGEHLVLRDSVSMSVERRPQ